MRSAVGIAIREARQQRSNIAARGAATTSFRYGEAIILLVTSDGLNFALRTGPRLAHICPQPLLTFFISWDKSQTF